MKPDKPMKMPELCHINEFNNYNQTEFSGWSDVYRAVGFNDSDYGNFQLCYEQWFYTKDTPLYQALKEE